LYRLHCRPNLFYIYGAVVFKPNSPFHNRVVSNMEKPDCIAGLRIVVLICKNSTTNGAPCMHGNFSAILEMPCLIGVDANQAFPVPGNALGRLLFMASRKCQRSNKDEHVFFHPSKIFRASLSLDPSYSVSHLDPIHLKTANILNAEYGFITIIAPGISRVSSLLHRSGVFCFDWFIKQIAIAYRFTVFCQH
jgi:hypothetical protein